MKRVSRWPAGSDVNWSPIGHRNSARSFFHCTGAAASNFALGLCKGDRSGLEDAYTWRDLAWPVCCTDHYPSELCCGAISMFSTPQWPTDYARISCSGLRFCSRAPSTVLAGGCNWPHTSGFLDPLQLDASDWASQAGEFRWRDLCPLLQIFWFSDFTQATRSLLWFCWLATSCLLVHPCYSGLRSAWSSWKAYWVAASLWPPISSPGKRELPLSLISWWMRACNPCSL